MTFVDIKQDHLRMNVAPDQIIILGRQIFHYSTLLWSYLLLLLKIIIICHYGEFPSSEVSIFTNSEKSINPFLIFLIKIWYEISHKENWTSELMSVIVDLFLLIFCRVRKYNQWPSTLLIDDKHKKLLCESLEKHQSLPPFVLGRAKNSQFGKE